MLGRSIPTRAEPVLQEEVQDVQEDICGSSVRRLAQEGLADREATGLAVGAQGASPLPLAVQPSAAVTRDAGGSSHGTCPSDLGGRSGSVGGPEVGRMDLTQEGF